tara:strand:- start:1120 stop:1479 length:360 start_codon:yes stop_codon:yes gene_type:complete
VNAMFNDVEIQKWIERHGVATSFTFIVYADISDEEVELLIKGLVVQITEHAKSMAVFFDKINEEQAVAWNVYRGTSLTFVFAGDKEEIEPIIKHIIEDGLEYLKYKAEYLSMNRSVSHV